MTTTEAAGRELLEASLQSLDTVVQRYRSLVATNEFGALEELLALGISDPGRAATYAALAIAELAKVRFRDGSTWSLLAPGGDEAPPRMCGACPHSMGYHHLTTGQTRRRGACTAHDGGTKCPCQHYTAPQ